jgi:tripartite ATP-independent transporter DctP family solute receptor
MKRYLFIVLLAVAALTAGCQKNVNAYGEEVITLRLAHGQAADSDVAKMVARLKTVFEEHPEEGLKLIIYDSSVLGSERQMIELVKAGVLDMAKVTSSSLDAFDAYYSIFALPYLFQSTEHYYRAMAESEAVRDIFEHSKKNGFFAVGYYPSGARNIYLRSDIPAFDPESLRGKKFRVMESPAAIRMIQLLGGTAVPMSMGEVYTALQQGVIDGAENTEMALTVNKHGEIIKAYTLTEHQYLPDIFLISTATWEKLSERQQNFLAESLKENQEEYRAAYEAMINKARQEAEKMGVIFYTVPDKSVFIKAVQPMHDEMKQRDSNFKRFYENIQHYK